MSSSIILNKHNIINKDNNELVYKFPKSITFGKNDSISLTHLNVYFSWFNISAKNKNNFFQYKWWNELGELVPYDVNIPSGYYSLSDLNEFLISVMVKNLHYIVFNDSFGYFIELLSNSVYYSIEIRLSSIGRYMTKDGIVYDITTSDQMFIPGNWIVPESSFECPEIIFPNNNLFYQLLGFQKGSSLIQNTIGDTFNKQYSFLNSEIPNMEPNSSFIITCNLIKNDLGSPQNILTSFTIPSGVGFGDLISPIDNVIYSIIREGIYDFISLKIYDQNFEPLIILDSNMLLILSIIQNIIV